MVRRYSASICYGILTLFLFGIAGDMVVNTAATYAEMLFIATLLGPIIFVSGAMVVLKWPQD